MAFKDRFRRAVGRSDRSSSVSSSSTAAHATPTTTSPGALTPVATSSAPVPQLTLTKTSSKLGLSKTLTWGSRRKEKSGDNREKKLEEWEKQDEREWVQPKFQRSGRKSKPHQDLLRAFEWKLKDVRSSLDGRRSGSMVSGISPGTSRVGSVDNGYALGRVWSNGRKRSSVAGPLSREVSRDEASGVAHPVGSVAEE